MKKFVSLAIRVILVARASWCHILDDSSSSTHRIPTTESPTPKSVRFHVAPMQGYTNLAFRQLFQELSPDATLWTEMEKVPDLLQADAAALARRFGKPGRKRIVLQLGGNDPVTIHQCIQRLISHGYEFDEINLNCGCPSIESGGAATYGASLMKQPDLTRALIAAMVDATSSMDTIVSMKCRAAVYDTVEEFQNEDRPEEVYRRLHEYIEHAQDGGISHLVLHARPAVLSGLSPIKNRQVPPVDHSLVRRVSNDFPLNVTLNGGITGLPRFQDLLQSEHASAGSFMAGRWMLRRPLDSAIVQSRILGHQGSEASQPVSKIALEAIQAYSDFSIRCCPQINDFCLPLFMVSEQIKEDYESENDDPNIGMMNYEAMEDIYDCIKATVQSLQNSLRIKPTTFSPTAIEFNKLNLAFTSLVGKKVVGKWERNRSEL